MQKIGVFVCWCGSNIAGTVDVAQVVEAVRQIPDVAYAIDYKYMCSEQGQELIRKAVADYKGGKTNVAGFLVGQCMKASRGQGNPGVLREMLLSAIEKL